MSMTMKLTWSCIASSIGGMAMFWFQTTATTVLDARFWISMFFSGAVPVATYLGGLAQKSPWDKPTLPMRTEETLAVTTSPIQGVKTVVEKKVTTTDPPPRDPPPGPRTYNPKED